MAKKKNINPEFKNLNKVQDLKKQCIKTIAAVNRFTNSEESPNSHEILFENVKILFNLCNEIVLIRDEQK